MCCFTKWFSIDTVFHSVMAVYFGPSLHSIVPLSPHRISKDIDHHAPLENPWPLFWQKNVDLWDETSLPTMLHGVASCQLLGAEACIGNTTTCINVQPLLSPANVSLQLRRRHNFAAYMGSHITSAWQIEINERGGEEKKWGGGLFLHVAVQGG